MVLKKLLKNLIKNFLGEIPINPEVGKCGDEGKPIVEANPSHEISKIYLEFAKKIKNNLFIILIFKKLKFLI